MKKNLIFYITAFISGLSVMAIELGASRLIAPYFSSSQIIWTIIIGTIMIAMSLGNVLGGKMADKSKNPDKLFILLFISATFVMLTPLFAKFVISAISLILALFITKNFLLWASLLSCVIIFVFPLITLGMVTPHLVKFSVKDLNESGKTVGIIEALNTIGSIIGTFIPTFVTIPFLGTSITFVIFASILYAVCLTYFILKKTKIIKSIIIIVITFIVGLLSNMIGTAFWENNVLYEGESIYNYLRVTKTKNSVILSTNVLFGVQSIKYTNSTLTGMYYDYALSSVCMSDKEVDENFNALVLGLGTGTFATQLETFYNVKNIDGVEIDKKIVDLAYEYFDMSKNINVFVEDGRAYINTCNKKYDIIMVDAYQDITIPFQMSSIEFFSLVKNNLKENGVMVVNMNMYKNVKGSINDYLIGTICSVFDNVYTCKTDGTNVVLFAGDKDLKSVLEDNKPSQPLELNNILTSTYNRLEKASYNGYVLTDDKAPVELLGMKVLDSIIEEELISVRSSIKGKSFKELITLLFSGELF